MKIIYLHQYFNTPNEPGSTRSYEMARRLIKMNHEVFLITSERNKENKSGIWYVSNINGIEVYWFSVPYNNAMSYPQRIKAFVKFAIAAAIKGTRFDADVVFATSTPLTIALPAVYIAKRLKAPMVFEVRDLWPELPIAIGALRGKLPVLTARFLERWAYRHAKEIVALSPGMKEGVVKQGYPEGKIHVIPNSADIDLFDVPADLGYQFRQQFNWLQDRPLVVYTGTLGKINGVDYLVHLAKKVNSINPDVRFLVVGSGGEQKKIETLASEVGVLNKTFFMMQPLAKTEMPAVLSAADVATSLFINLPEMWANSANKFFDALASGTAVAINYRGWQADLISEHEAGIVLDPVDTTIAATQLVRFLENPTLLKDAGIAARRLAVEQFARDKLALQLENVLLRAIEKSS